MPEAQALAVRGDRIVALGASADIRRYVGPATEVVDLQGQLAIPGFIEGHGHFNGVGTAELQLKLMKTTSWNEIVSMVAAAVKTAKRGQWIYGRGWHQEKWTSKPDPERRGFPDPCVARRGVAGQPGGPHARERPRQLCKQPRAPALRHLEDHAEPAWRGAPQGRGRGAHRADARARVRPDPPRHRGAGPHRGGEPGARPQDSRARVARGHLEGHHDVSGCRLVVCRRGPDEGDGGRTEDGRPPVDHDPREQRGARAEPRQVPDGGLRGRAPHRARDQAFHRRRARLARGVAARTVLRQAGQHRAEYDDARCHCRERGARRAARLPDVRPRDRRSRQSRNAQHLRAGVQGEPGQSAICGGAWSTRSTSACPTFRASGSLA